LQLLAAAPTGASASRKREAPARRFGENSPMSFTGKRYDFRDQAGDYAHLAEELAGLLSGESDFVANAANTTALIFDACPISTGLGFTS